MQSSLDREKASPAMRGDRPAVTRRSLRGGRPSRATPPARFGPWIRFSLLLLMLAALTPSGSPAQERESAGDSVTATAGARYRAGFLRRVLLGAHYRDLWTTPVRVELLDLRSTAGGLTPLRTGGGMQTRSLRFMGADGREYSFRSVDKDPSPILDPMLLETFVHEVVQDAISAAHPYGALVAAPLLDTLDILHVDPRLRVMPDDPALGEFRGEFAGMLGLVEERPDENAGDRTAFRGTDRVIGSDALMALVDAGPEARVDEREFLKARLMDVFLGDWDRHRDQWRWATFDRGSRSTWLPVPRDRDYAFAKFDGFIPSVVGLYVEQFVRFGDGYPSIKRLHWHARELDRRFLSELDRAAWDSLGTWMQERLTDDVISRAARQLPAEIHELDGEQLEQALRSRRDRLPDAWTDFYGVLAEKVDIHGTDSDEIVTVDRSTAGSIMVRIAAADDPHEPYYSRRFLTGETSEVRLYLKGGDDLILVHDDAETSIMVRVVGGPGDDVFEVYGNRLGLRLYDARGRNRVVGDGAPDIDDRPFRDWEWTPEDRAQPLDWGGWNYPIFWTSYSSDLGLFLGGGVRLERYGFRKRPFAAAFDVRAGYSPSIDKGRFQVDGRLQRENSPLFWILGARVSRLDVLHYYGLGNQSEAGSRSFHEVDLTSTRANVGIGLEHPTGFEAHLSATLERSSTRPGTDRYFGTLGPVYGSGSFIHLGLGAHVGFDPLADAKRTSHRFRIRAHGTVWPRTFDVQDPYGRLAGDASLLLASSPWPRLALNVRAGAEKAVGTFPWFGASFIGGTGTVRGLDEQRYAGDLAGWGSVELRLRAWTPTVVVPMAVGVLGFTDVGRVWVGGASPGGWHTTVGGGLYLRPFGQPYLVRFGAGRSDEATKLFVGIGLPY